MTTTDSSLQEIDLSSLEAVSGGFKWDGNSPRSTNVLDCRGPTCLDSTGKVDWAATRQHKKAFRQDRLPRPDGGPPRKPKAPGDR